MIPLLPIDLPVIRHETGDLLSGRIYVIASITVFIIYMVAGHRKKIPLNQLMAGAATFFLFFTLGSRLPAISATEWCLLLSHGQWPGEGNRTILGGLAGMLAGMLVFAAWIRNSHRVFDLVAIVLSVGMGIQRITCLLSGCCSGMPTSLPWAIRYDQHSDAWNSQLMSGQITPADLCSLPVHPTQGYDIVAWVLIFFLAARAARYFRSPGNRLLLTILLYGFFRFFLEFLRDPFYDIIPGAFGGIRYVQWMILAGLPLPVLIIMARERWAGKAGKPDTRKEAGEKMMNAAIMPVEETNQPVEETNQSVEVRNQSEEMRNQSEEEISSSVEDREFACLLILTMIVVTLFLPSWRLLNMPEILAMILLLASLFITTAIRVFRKTRIPGFGQGTSLTQQYFN